MNYLLLSILLGFSVNTEFSGNTSPAVEVVTITVNSFDQSSVDEFRRLMAKATLSGQPIIPIVIDSNGGSVYGLFAMIDIIQSSKVPVATIIEGAGFSAGAVLFSFGTKGYRYIAKHGTIMVHEVSSGAGGKVPDMRSDTNEAERLDRIVLEELAKNCGKPANFFRDEINKRGRADWYIDPKQAVEIGLADHIGIPTLKIKFNVTSELVNE